MNLTMLSEALCILEEQIRQGMKNTDNCGNCRHWDSQELGWGTCVAASHNTFFYLRTCCCAILQTYETFYCNQHMPHTPCKE